MNGSKQTLSTLETISNRAAADSAWRWAMAVRITAALIATHNSAP